MRHKKWLAVALGALLLSGCAGMDPEEREFFSRDILRPRMDPDEKAFWYSGWWTPGKIDQ